MDTAAQFSKDHLRCYVEFTVKRPENCLVQAPEEKLRGIVLGHSDIPKFNIDAGCLRILCTDTPSPVIRTIPMEWLIDLTVDGKSYEEETFEDKTFQVRGSKGNYYTVTERVDGSRTCSCPGFMYRKKCRHV